MQSQRLICQAADGVAGQKVTQTCYVKGELSDLKKLLAPKKNDIGEDFVGKDSKLLKILYN